MIILNKLHLLALIFLLNACVSIPVSTMIKMYRYDVEDYLRIDPAVLRMRITSDSDDPLVVENTKLTMQLTLPNGEQTNLGGALVIDTMQDIKPDKGFLSFGYEPEHIYVLKLDDEGIASFRELAKTMLKRMEYKKRLEQHGVEDERKGNFSMGAAYDFRDKKEARLIIELLFNNRDGYFVLLNKVRFPPDAKN